MLMADTGAHGLLYAVSAVSLLSIIALPLIGGEWQMKKGTLYPSSHILQRQASRLDDLSLEEMFLHLGYLAFQ